MPATPPARRRSAPPAPSSLLPPAASIPDDDEATRTERDDVERRRYWLLKLPQIYTPKHRERYVFLNLDNTTASLVKSPLLFRCIKGATCPHDIRIHFEALTDHLCGASSSAVVAHQLAIYSKTNPNIAQALKKFGWATKTTGNDDKVLQTELLMQLQKGAATANGKALVLVMGGGRHGTGNMSAFQEIISKFLVEGWHVEIHAWLRALNDGYIRLQSENPGRVAVMPLDDVINDIVYLKKKKRSSAGVKHVCSVLNQGEAPLKVLTSPVPESAAPETVCNNNSPSQRLASVSPILKRAHSVPPATSPNASWIKAAMQGQQAATNSPASTSSLTSTSSSSHLNDFAGAAAFTPPLSRSESAPPGFPCATTPMQSAFTPPLPPLPPLESSMMNSVFNSPFLPTPTQPAYRWMLWELQLQQMSDLISAQQADLVMRQCTLQQTMELMRLMQDQERSTCGTWQPTAGTYQQPNGTLSPWNDTWGV
ncbi:hypothetical protein P3T76_011026 [Phytophthora citrophthora]|uniref:Uncharacterized protein n=1 Tax=Phytophthora citrophthora TaxID=4793 RepID=A0AAD9LG74_9STRA|nr:hypothetical protein P3T76_011026 [Phytophthora citrophthora]